MTEHQILVTRRPPGNAVAILESEAPTWIWDHDRPMERPALLEEIGSAAGLYCMLTDQIDQELLDVGALLTVVSQMAVGVDNINLEACRQRGVRVGHTPDVLTETTADVAFGLMLAAARRFKEGTRDVSNGAWGDWDPNYLVGQDVHDSTLGIIGFGRIGQAVARRAAGFGMEVLYTQRHQNEASPATFTTLDDLLDKSDHVIVAAPLTAQTHHLISGNELSRMKPTATLVNIARGQLVDPDALYQALAGGDIWAAGLDVTDPEPISPDHALVAAPNCYIIPHLGSATVRTRIKMAEMAARNLVAGLRGEPLEAEIDTATSSASDLVTDA